MRTSWLNDVVQLFYPTLCLGCGMDLPNRNQHLCTQCRLDLPHTHFARIPYNPIEKLFLGRLPINFAHSEFYFTKDGVVQRLIHQLKYQRQAEIGNYLGNLIGQSLLESERLPPIDVLIPMPISQKRAYKRGYNQAALIGEGIGEVLNVPVWNTAVQRYNQTSSQTKKNRLERWKNVAQQFFIPDPKSFINKTILLVDDVITTGASMEACGQEILKISGTNLAIVSAAFTIK
jgi:ComF family protein